jgi:hypothetical protein
MITSRILNYWSLLVSAVVVFVILAVVFSTSGMKSITEEHPAVLYAASGMEITLGSQDAAELYGVRDGPGTYVSTVDGQIRPAVPYGLLLAAQGLAAGHGWQVTMGFKALAVGVMRSRTGLAGLVLLVLVIAGVVVIRNKRRNQQPPSAQSRSHRSRHSG